jgi:DNA-binding protein Fis
MNIDWSKAPEGATHFISTSAAKYWFKKVGDNFYAYNGTGWNANHANPSGVSMREMFEIPRPKPTENPVDQPKTLTQAVFDGLPPEYRWAAVDSEGRAYAHKCTPKGATAAYWLCVRGCAAYLIGEGYDTTNWQNSLIERQDVSSRVERLRSVEAARKHSHYFKDVSGVDQIDVYAVLRLFEVTDPCLQHIVKKALCAGKRGAKDWAKDVQEIADTAQRLIELESGK